MELKIIRKEYTNRSTIGELFIDNEFFCYTLEDKVRKEKIKGKTAINAGCYSVIINYSNRFKQKMPLLLDVPKFTGVRIHYGNTSKDTEGCILVGIEKTKNTIYKSRQTYKELMEIIGKETDMCLEIYNTKEI